MSSFLKYALVAVAAALGAGTLAVEVTRDSSRPAAVAATAGMPMLRSWVGAPGSLQAEKPSARDLDSVRNQVTTWLVKNGFEGYSVGEVMAFTNNDYVLIETPRGAGAFELLAAPGAGWLMQEPPSMLWNTRFGMKESWQANWSGSGMMASLMGGGRGAGQWDGWDATATTKVKSEAKALRIANRWLARARPGERATAARSFPGYFTLDTMVGNKKAGMLSVNAATAGVWYHGWHGGFLAERDYS
jgi:hypothetical protein